MFRDRNKRLGFALSIVAVAAAIAFYLLWEIAHRGVYAYNTSIYPVDSADEWRYTACSRLVAHGYAMFTQVFSAQPPLLFASLAGGMRVFGDSIDGARWVEILFGLVAILSVAWIAYRLAGPSGAAIGTILLAVSPGFLVYAHTIEAEGPMLALCALSIALTFEFVHRRGGEGRPSPREQGAPGATLLLLVAAGLALAAAILMKLFALEVVLPALALLMLGRSAGPDKLRSAAVFLTATFLPVALEFALVAPAEQWRQVVQLHNAAATAQLSNLTPAGTILGDYLGLDLGLTILAGIGLVVLVWRFWEERRTTDATATEGRATRDLAFVGLWLGGSIVMLALFRPLFPHHAAILSAPLAVAAAASFSALGRLRHSPTAHGPGERERMQERPDGMPVLASRSDGGRARAIGALLVAGILAYLALVPRLAHDDRHFLLPTPSASSDPLVAYVSKHTTANQLVLTDDPRIADAARRLVPAPLCDPSNVRMRSGYLTRRDLISATVTYRPRLVIPSFGIFKQVPGYIPWLAEHYVKIQGPDGAAIYERKGL